MKKLLLTTALVSAIALSATSGAYAKSHPRTTKQQRLDHVAEYWTGESTNTGGEHQASDTIPASKASQYPCKYCVYDQKAGGYVQKTVGKR